MLSARYRALQTPGITARWSLGSARVPSWLRLNGDRLCLLLLPVALAAALLLVPPVGEFAVDDDWVYAQAVKQLLADGVYRPSIWIDTTFVAQAWWGAGVSLLLGYSHTALRLSTLLLAGGTLVLFYLLLRRSLRPLLALLTALLLLFNPLFFHLSYTFMTDVPFLAAMLAAIWCLSLALEPGHDAPAGRLRLGWLAAGSILIGLACLVRQVGIVLAPLALFAALSEIAAAVRTYRARCWRPLLAFVAPCSLVLLIGSLLTAQPHDVTVDTRLVDVLPMLDPASLWTAALRVLGLAAALLGIAVAPAAPLVLWSGLTSPALLSRLREGEETPSAPPLHRNRARWGGRSRASRKPEESPRPCHPGSDGGVSSPNFVKVSILSTGGTSATPPFLPSPAAAATPSSSAHNSFAFHFWLFGTFGTGGYICNTLVSLPLHRNRQGVGGDAVGLRGSPWGLLAAPLLLALGYVVAVRGAEPWYGLGPVLLAVAAVVPWARLRVALAGGAIVAVIATAVVSAASLSPLFGNNLTAAGFTPSGLHPQAISVNGLWMVALVAASLFGAMALIVAVVGQLSLTRLPLSARLLVLASLGMLVVTLGYETVDGPFNGLYDRYLIPVLPGALLLSTLVIRERRLAVPVLAVGVLVFAGWSITWQREYMQRQAAIWQLARTIVEEGVPPSTIGAGFEWNGTYRAEAVIPQARDEAIQAGDPRQFVQRVIDGIYRPRRWSIDLTPPSSNTCPDQPPLTITYGDDWLVYGARRCFPRAGSGQ